jgi:hypothetical protein
LIDEPTKNFSSSGIGKSMSNAIDKETKHFAMRIKRCPNFKQYKGLAQNLSGK